MVIMDKEGEKMSDIKDWNEKEDEMARKAAVILLV